MPDVVRLLPRAVIGPNLRARRQARGIPVLVFARDLGVAACTVSDWESGRSAVPRKRHAAVAALLGIDPASFDAAAPAETSDERVLLDHFRNLSPGEQAGLLALAADRRRKEAARA